MRTTRTRIATALATSGAVTALALGAGLAAPAQAVTIGSKLCTLTQNTQVYATARHGGYLYTIAAGRAFRVTNYTDNFDHAYGHGNGGADGWIRNDGRIVNCRW